MFLIIKFWCLVKKQHLAVTTEMRLAQEEAEKYRNLFGMAEEIKQTSEKVYKTGTLYFIDKDILNEIIWIFKKGYNYYIINNYII